MYRISYYVLVLVTSHHNRLSVCWLRRGHGDGDDTFDVAMAAGHTGECATHSCGVLGGEVVGGGSGCERRAECGVNESRSEVSHAEMHHLFDSALG